MYYDNKSTFYIKQYGPKVLVAMISILLVVGGVYIYLASTSNNQMPQNNIVAEDNNNTNEDTTKDVVEVASKDNTSNTEVVEETSSLKNEDNLEISTTISKKLADLKPLVKSDVATVKKVTDNNTVIVNIDNKNLEINLIGVDFSKSTSELNSILKSDLEGKEVKIAFDKTKVKDMKLYGYIYVGETLYNASIIEKGQAIVKVESTNTSLLDTLISAQTKAKLNKTGIWA